MSRDAELHSEKVELAKAHFNRLNAITEFGVKKHTIAWCVAATAKKFFLKPKTIENYIYSN